MAPTTALAVPVALALGALGLLIASSAVLYDNVLTRAERLVVLLFGIGLVVLAVALASKIWG